MARHRGNQLERQKQDILKEQRPDVRGLLLHNT